jgi:hypothetical protein
MKMSPNRVRHNGSAKAAAQQSKTVLSPLRCRRQTPANGVWLTGYGAKTGKKLFRYALDPDFVAELRSIAQKRNASFIDTIVEGIDMRLHIALTTPKGQGRATA